MMFLAPTGRGQENRQTSEATECRRRVTEGGLPTEYKAPRAKLGAGRADGAGIAWLFMRKRGGEL